MTKKRSRRNCKKRPRYPTDLSDKKWAAVKDLIPAKKDIGRPREVSMRRLLEAVFYMTRAGCAWRMLPKEHFPPWETVYGYFYRWSRSGVWQRIHDTLRARVRQQAGRQKHPTAGSIDAQSVKTSASAGVKGFDAGKKIQGRKRHILVDTLGLLMAVVVTAASVQDRDGAKLLLQSLPGSCKKIRRIGSMAVIGESLSTRSRATFTSFLRWFCVQMMSKASNYCRVDGLSNELSPGCIATAASPRTTRYSLDPASLSSILP